MPPRRGGDVAVVHRDANPALQRRISFIIDPARSGAKTSEEIVSSRRASARSPSDWRCGDSQQGFADLSTSLESLHGLRGRVEREFLAQLNEQ